MLNTADHNPYEPPAHSGRASEEPTNNETPDQSPSFSALHMIAMVFSLCTIALLWRLQSRIDFRLLLFIVPVQIMINVLLVHEKVRYEKLRGRAFFAQLVVAFMFHAAWAVWYVLWVIIQNSRDAAGE